MRIKSPLGTVLCLCLPAAAAGQTLINFDSLDCSSNPAITTEFAGLGVSLFSNPYCREAVLDGSSPANLLVGDLLANPPTGPGSSKTPISWDYSWPVPYTTVVGLDVGDDGLQLECFSAAGDLLGYDFIPPCPPLTPPGMGPLICTDSSGAGVGHYNTLVVSAAGILSCTVSQLTSDEPFDGFAIDDVTFPVELQSFSVE